MSIISLKILSVSSLALRVNPKFVASIYRPSWSDPGYHPVSFLTKFFLRNIPHVVLVAWKRHILSHLCTFSQCSLWKLHFTLSIRHHSIFHHLKSTSSSIFFLYFLRHHILFSSWYLTWLNFRWHIYSFVCLLMTSPTIIFDAWKQELWVVHHSKLNA